MRWPLLLTLAGCVDEYDPSIIAVLPDVPFPCEALGAASLEVRVMTVDGEDFSVRTDACRAGLYETELSGFEVRVDRITRGYHHLEARLLDASGGELGRVGRPFAADAPVIVPFARADLPAWPEVTLLVELPPCDHGDQSLAAHVPDLAGPVVERTVTCDDSPPTILVPRGQVALAITGPCGQARSELFAFSPGVVDLSEQGACP